MIRVACSAVCKRIRAGRVNKAGDAFIGAPDDVTSDFFKAVVDFFGVGEPKKILVNGEQKYEVVVLEIDAAHVEQVPYGCVYEYDCGPDGVYRDFEYGQYNGRYPDRTVTVYTAPAQPAVVPVAVTRPYPDQITDELKFVLGWPNFRCGPLAHLFRAAGHDIKPRSEDEQAFVLHWLVKLVLDHGAGWSDMAQSQVDAMRAASAPAAPQEPV